MNSRRDEKIYGRRIKARREALDISQGKLAADAGLKLGTIQRIEPLEIASVIRGTPSKLATGLRLEYEEFRKHFMPPAAAPAESHDKRHDIAPPAPPPAPPGRGDKADRKTMLEHGKNTALEHERAENTPIEQQGSVARAAPPAAPAPIPALPADLAAQVRSYAKSNGVTHDAAVISLLWGGIREWQDQPGVKKAASKKPRGGDGKPPKK
jgi:transcriptional regulator with XRE-family HTH domain